MLDAPFGMLAGGDGEIDPRVFQHPLGVVRLGDRRLGAEERRIEADRRVDVLDPDVHVQAFHEQISFASQAGSPVAEPAQQFSIRKPTSRSIAA